MAEARMEILPAADHNQVQAMLIMEVTSGKKANLNIVSIINSCGWPVNMRIICDDLDCGDQVLPPHQMCKFSFITKRPAETIVFCQTWSEGRTLNFDVWGGTAPRGLNVWTLLSDLEMGLALNGTIKKSWTVYNRNARTSLSDITDEDEEDLNDEHDDYFYFHKGHVRKEFQNLTGVVPDTDHGMVI